MKNERSRGVPLKVWLLVSLTLLAKTNTIMPVDYSMKFKPQQSHYQDCINVLSLYKCP